MNTITETVTTGFFSRIGNSIKGILVGLLLIVAAFPILFINEGCAVKIRKTLDQGSKEVIHLDAPKVDAANEGKLVHLTGKATSDAELIDPQFHVKTQALKLRRKVETYQWKEEKSTKTKKQLGGSKKRVTTYNYTKVWNEGYIDSSSFKDSNEHHNPQPTYTSKTWIAPTIHLGDFVLNSHLIDKISDFKPFFIEDSSTSSEKKGTSTAEKKTAKQNSTSTSTRLTPTQTTPRLINGEYYIGLNPSAPAIGDTKISFLKIDSPTEVSVIAKQSGKTFEAFVGDSGSTIEMLSIGHHSAASMFEEAQNNNKIRTWIVRFSGFLAMFIGFSMLFKPFSVIADVLPIAGTIVGVGTSIVAFLLAAPLSLITISIAWIVYRPLIGVPIALAGCFGFFLLIKKLITYKKSQNK